MLSERCFKKENILQCLSKNADVKKLRHFSISRYGLVDNDVRKIVWPMLVGGNCGLSDIDPEILKNHPSCHQVELDTCRMTSLIPKESTPEEIESIQKIVTRLVLSVLVDNPSLHYYQVHGFHDICYIFFSVLGEKRSRILINKLIPTHFSAKEVESTPLDFALLYQTLARLPKLHPVEELIHEALKIYIDLGPDKLIELGNKRILKYREQKLLTPSTSMRQPFPKSMHYNHLLLWNTVIQHRRTIFSLSFIVIVVSYLLNKSLKG
ncbi:TBC1 domain family member 20 [Schistosoma japonicum]|nr:TBC1 domain family member 20 [Schistosoma japonicum]